MTDEYITVNWAGEIHRRVRVVKRFKNGNINVAIDEGRWTGGRMGYSTPPTIVRVDPWQIIEP